MIRFDQFPVKDTMLYKNYLARTYGIGSPEFQMGMRSMLMFFHSRMDLGDSSNLHKRLMGQS